ncbi:MAG: ATP-binding protein [Candidatus Methanoperedens sp.]|nr:ATP-binding protein [Candidatus Methanoperedens sp.]
MLFNKALSKVDYSDIDKLRTNEIAESVILDYKRDYNLKDEGKNLLKEVTSFSNSNGGFLIYGIEEIGSGGYPKEILGIEKNINLETLEQIIIGNIRPRINVQMKKIDIPNSEKIILIISIPEGQNKPYYNNKVNKFFKRYNFEAKEMDEHEIEALYQQRFFGVGRLAKYVEDTILFNRGLISIDLAKLIDAHIIITPLKVDEKIIDSMQKLNFNVNSTKFDPEKDDLYLSGFASPSRYGIKWSEEHRDMTVEIHRNGLIHYMKDYNDGDKISKELWEYGLSVDVLRTIQFSNLVYSTLNFIGKVKIILKIKNTNNSYIFRNYGDRKGNVCLAEDIFIEREWDSWRLSEDYLKIGQIIMDEFNNYYGMWQSRYFSEEKGEIKFKKQ